MEEKDFNWSSELTKKLFKLRFENEELFNKLKQPWLEFHKILLQNGFPEEITISRVRKKWGYHWDIYKHAKKSKNKNVKYYKLFDKHFGKNKVLDKYASWPEKWRLKLITCITETMAHSMDPRTMWRTVETAMRSQDLPDDCCIQDIKGLWHHIKTTFSRKYRMALKKDGVDVSRWPLYDTMLHHYETFDPQYLIKLEAEGNDFMIVQKGNKKTLSKKKDVDDNANENEFTWSKDLTESFIQIKLQNDWLFRDKTQPWKEFTDILREEHGFPEYLSIKCIAKKWGSTYSDYQKAKATNNTSWLYYNIFEAYLGEGSLSLNPLIDWGEQWVLNLINARTSLESDFQNHGKHTRCNAWREVEKRLRVLGIPLTHSLLDLPEIWAYLRRTFKWKHKFAIKGVLTEQWPYYDAMAYYENMLTKLKEKEEKIDLDYEMGNDDLEDDMKLIDLKEKIGVEFKPKEECEVKCRACAGAGAGGDVGAGGGAGAGDRVHYADIYDTRDDDGTDLATKLKLVAGIEADKSDKMTTLICYTCIKELEIAYKFRRKCQTADRELREALAEKMQKIKVEYDENDFFDDNLGNDDTEQISENVKSEPQKIVKKERPKKKYKARKPRYEYRKICEVCGKNTQNLMAHMDAHTNFKQYSCDVCDKKFKFKSGLIIHKAVHEEKPRKTCDVCGKTFHILAQFRRHYSYHANERKFGCETCGKRFNTMDILKVHQRSHTDERPFSCPECGKSFRTAGCVTRHKRIVHKITKKLQ